MDNNKDNMTSSHRPDFPAVELNRQMAYSHSLGRWRETFVGTFIRQKQSLLKDIDREIAFQLREDLQTLTCRQGCSACCSLYVEASLQECEAIVYSLYQDPPLLRSFLQGYTYWYEKMLPTWSIFLACRNLLNQARNGRGILSLEQELVKALQSYRELDVPCPFLAVSECSIYSVRPYTCAVHAAVSPAEFCLPASGAQPSILDIHLPEEIADLSFFLGELESPFVSSMAETVYQILSRGYDFLNGIANNSSRPKALQDAILPGVRGCP
jgi:Fe-S-cluster containining protein